MSSIFPMTSFFSKMLTDSLPPADRLAAARELPPLVRDYLKELDTFATSAPHSRLVGSYAQKLSVGDIKDVDFLIRIEGNPENNEPSARTVVRSLKSALEGLGEYLGYQGSCVDVDVSGARRSAHVYFKDEDFHLDVVPCIAPQGFGSPIYVPDKGYDRWILSDPLGYISKLNELNKEHGGKVKKVARLLKLYIKQSMIYMRPKSYWLGALLLNLIDSKGFDSDLPLGELFYWTCDELYKQYDHLLWTSESATPAIPDPLLGHDISPSWSRNDFQSFMRHLKEAREEAQSALSASNVEDAIRHWRNIFGDIFPESVEEEASAKASLYTPGVAVMATAGMTSPLLVQATRFHGD